MFIYRIIKYLYNKLKHYLNILKTLTVSLDIENYNSLLITHNYAGGTELYIDNVINEDKSILIIRILSYFDDYGFILEDKNKKLKKFISKFPVIPFSTQRIVVNSLVGCYKWDKYLDKFIHMKNCVKSISIEYLLHDYHCLCPKFNLLYNNSFCNLECDKYGCKFNYFLDRTKHGIDYWRTKWGNFLFVIDRVQVFSISSYGMIKKCYPNMDESKILLKPHSMDYSTFKKVKYSKYPLHIGIVGNLSLITKGKLVVQDLLRKMDKNIKFYIIGSTYKDLKIKQSNLVYLGKYKRDDLEQIVLDNGINFIVFPSVWPETFSYLISELIQMDLPILAFNLGAQAEKLINYEKGFLCSEISSDALAKKIQELSVNE